MILPLPIKFDANEWWVTAGLVVSLSAFILLPRQFPKALTFIILLFTASLAITIDFILAPDYPFNAYDAMDTPKYDLFDFIMDTVNYSIYGYLFLYFYDKLQLKGLFRLLFIAFWIALSLGLEWISIKLNVFRYDNWNLAYSCAAYMLIFHLYLLFLHMGKLAIRRYSDTP